MTSVLSSSALATNVAVPTTMPDLEYTPLPAAATQSHVLPHDSLRQVRGEQLYGGHQLDPPIPASRPPVLIVTCPPLRRIPQRPEFMRYRSKLSTIRACASRTINRFGAPHDAAGQPDPMHPAPPICSPNCCAPSPSRTTSALSSRARYRFGARVFAGNCPHPPEAVASSPWAACPARPPSPCAPCLKHEGTSVTWRIVNPGGGFHRRGDCLST